MRKMLAVLALVSGCSVALQAKPRTAGADCSKTNAYWIADAVGVAAGVAAVAASFVMSGNDAPNTVGGVGAVGSVLYLASAGNGHRWARECRASQETPVASR